MLQIIEVHSGVGSIVGTSAHTVLMAFRFQRAGRGVVWWMRGGFSPKSGPGFFSWTHLPQRLGRLLLSFGHLQ